ncbi:MULTISPECIES: ATP-binding cassette domain-containing protein [unclassified Rhizobium]|uniref:amino acid ABC transporter ATP-binding/permease protein n=1 Tax=unclassified Rhizobium TaxID=2613769 RepID=UPI000EA8FD79|nr:MULTISPECIES: ATP-binding cassette domain-containing protein [unclassified Rhizobium]AYG68966.1 ATP-binding cassette domain-containing protein [Rhizobium sp. CCGE531]AYG75352.1 ATP-binding cassette domain-containing protein [Rhizobium sp. CCGE532]
MTRSLKTLLPLIGLFWRERGKSLALGAALSVLAMLAGGGLLGLSGWFITASAFAGLTVATAAVFDVFAPSAGIRMLAIGRTAARYGERLVTHDATLRVLAALRERLFRGWAEPGAAAAMIRRPAKLLFRLTNDVDALDSLYVRVLVPAAAAVLAAIAVTIALSFIDPWLGVAAGAWLVALCLGLSFIAGRLALKPGRRRAHAMEALRARAIDLVAGQTDLAMAGQLHAQRAAIAEADARLAKADNDLNRIDSAVAAGFSLGSTVLLTATLLAVAFLARQGTIGAPAAAFALLIAFAATEPFAAMRRGALELGRTLLAARRIAPRLNPDAASLEPIEPQAGYAFQLAGVVAGHDGASVLKDVSLSLAVGERLAIVGQSGVGKSTLLALLAGEIVAANGSVTSLPAAMLTQRTELFQDTVRGNLKLSDLHADDSQLRSALATAGLLDDIEALQHGLSTRLGEGGGGLSGGQLRRLALARLLLRDTPLWLLDEPTEGLDATSARAVLARLASAADARSLVIATHIRREAALADRIVLLDGGRIAASARRDTPEFERLLDRLRPD